MDEKVAFIRRNHPCTQNLLIGLNKNTSKLLIVLSKFVFLPRTKHIHLFYGTIASATFETTISHGYATPTQFDG